MSTASQAWLFHGLHPLRILVYLDYFTVPTVSQSQHIARLLIKAAEGISAFTVALVVFEIIVAQWWHWHMALEIFVTNGPGNGLSPVHLTQYLHSYVYMGCSKQCHRCLAN